MRLYEYVDGKELFKEINLKRAFEFIEEPTFLDQMLVTFYGNREMFSPVDSWKADTLASALIMHFSFKWDSLVKQQILLENPNNRREITETVSSEETRNNTREDVAKVAAFNSDVMVVNDGNDSIGSDTSQGQRIKTLTDEYIDVQLSFNTLSNGSKNSIIRQVLDDVASFMTLSVY